LPTTTSTTTATTYLKRATKKGPILRMHKDGTKYNAKIAMFIAIGCICGCPQVYSLSSVYSPGGTVLNTFQLPTYRHRITQDLRRKPNQRSWSSLSIASDRTRSEILTEEASEEDFEEQCASGESCSLDHQDMYTDIDYDDDYDDDDGSLYALNSIPLTYEEIKTKFPFDPILMIPLFTPFLAYMTYDDIAKVFDFVFNLLARERHWVPVDGGAYQARIIAPAINGIVVPCISILFATLTSNTVSTLRQRQIDIHTFLNCEAGDLRMLSSLVDAYPQSALKGACREYLKQYTCRLIAESLDSKTSKVMFGSTDSEMNGFVAALNQLAIGSNGEDSPPSVVLSESYGAVVRLNSIRSSRITALQSTYPVLHYGILALLAASICLAFLIETNQELLIFLNAIKLRILWMMLI
jgi:hypothetical protein